LLGALAARLGQAGVDASAIDVVTPRELDSDEGAAMPPGVGLSAHAPHDRERMAYLASTKSGRRVYLNRRVVDADVVIAIGRVGPDPALGMRGPASAVFPDLSDKPRAFSAAPAAERGETTGQIDEINWLLGITFQVAAVPSDLGLDSVYAGAASAVRRAAERRHRERWSVVPTALADLVIAAVGEPDAPPTWDEIGNALAAAARCVKPDGQIVLCGRSADSPPAALKRLAASDDARATDRALAAAIDEADYETAAALARARDHARVCFYGTWSEPAASLLGFAQVDNQESLQRLLSKCERVALLSRADQVHAASLTGEDTLG
jgi:hypothetical protein